MALTKRIQTSDTVVVLQLSSKNAMGKGRRKSPLGASNLLELRAGEQGVLERLDLPEDTARRLMELGFLPGARITAARSAPGGDPRVFRVDGTEIALRCETAARLALRVKA